MVLERLFGSRLRAAVLSRVLMQPERRFYVRQLTAVLGQDSTNVSRELSRLAEMGILEFTVEGRQKYYRANRNCPFIEELRGLVRKTAGTAAALRSALSPLAAGIRFAFLFGSCADGRETAASDIDVLVVGRVSARAVSAALAPASRALSREINPVVYGSAEFRERMKRGDHFVTGLMRGTRLFLLGDDHDIEAVAH